MSLAIVNGTVYDGTGADGRRANLRIDGDRVVEITPDEITAEKVIDAGGCAVAPGFIDIHTHSDVSLVMDPRGLSKLRQGVTCEVVGNCGMSPAPLLGDSRQRDAMAYMDQETDWPWSDYADYVRRLDGCSLNVASLVGHIALRSTVMGFEDRPPTAAELQEMRSLLAECFRAGATGFTTGLIYPPSCYANQDEIAALAEVVAEHGGLYASHIRGEGRTLQNSIAECIETGRRSGCRVQISHMKAAGRAHWGGVHDSLAQVEAAVAEGLDVAFDVYPYDAGATQLSALLPPWVHEGGKDAMLGRLTDPTIREQIVTEAKNPPPSWRGYTMSVREDWEARRITYTADPAGEWMVGENLWDIAEEMGLEPYDAVCEILVRDGAKAEFVAFHLNEDDVRTVLRHPLASVASDGLAIAPEGVLGRGKPHPRFYGTFPRVLGHYARDEHLFPLAEAIRKMTSAPADRMGFADRGRLAPGKAADVVIFDPATVIDVADYENPHRFPAGIRHVIVNGKMVVDYEEVTSARPGRLLRR